MAAPDHHAAAHWCRRGADAGDGGSAHNLANLYSVGRGGAWQRIQIMHMPCCVILQMSDPCFLSWSAVASASHDVASVIRRVLGRGVTRSKRRAIQWTRKAAESGHVGACLLLAARMYMNLPNARQVGHVEAAEVVSSAGVAEGHDVPPDVLTGVVHWLRKGGQLDPTDKLDAFRRSAVEGGMFCRNDGCTVVGLLKDFKVCPLCKSARYCGAACQKEDWTTGGHKATCGTFAYSIRSQA